MSGCAAIMTCTVCDHVNAQVQTGSAQKWLAGKALQRNANLPFSVSWTETPIRDQLNSIANQQRRSIFLDRRIDPTRRLTLSIRDVTTEQAVWQTAASADLSVARVGDLLYVGPTETTSRMTAAIADLKKQASKLSRSAAAKWKRKSEIQWSEATSTDEIIRWFEETHSIKFDSEITHDVWPAGDWSSLSLLEQVSLFLAGFDLSFKIQPDGSTLQLVPFPDFKTSQSKVRLGRRTKFDNDLAEAKFTDLKIKKSGKTVLLSGPVESIALFEAWIVGQQKVAGEDSIVRTFDLKTTAPRGDILATLAYQTGRELKLQPGVAEILQKRITINAQKATPEDLVKQCLDGTNLTYDLSDKVLSITESP